MAFIKPKPKIARAAAQRVFIVEDQPIVRERLRDVINRQPDLTVCGEADDAHPALELIEAAPPDLVITGLSFKRAQGLGFIKDLHARFPRLRVLVFSMYDELLYAERAVRAGACGFVHKRETTDELLRAIRHVLGGQVYLSEKISAAKLRQLFGRPLITPGSPLEQLSDRELEVLQLIGQGHSTRQIAAALHLDVKTVETYRSRIKLKLKLNNAVELLREARRYSLEYATSPAL